MLFWKVIYSNSFLWPRLMMFYVTFLKGSLYLFSKPTFKWFRKGFVVWIGREKIILKSVFPTVVFPHLTHHFQVSCLLPCYLPLSVSDRKLNIYKNETHRGKLTVTIIPQVCSYFGLVLYQLKQISCLVCPCIQI